MNAAIQVLYYYTYVNTLYGMLIVIECQNLCFKQEDQSVRMNEQRTNDGAGRVLRSE